MKLFNWIEEHSFKISRGYWNVLLLISGIALLLSALVFIWSIFPVMENRVIKEPYPESTGVSKTEIEQYLGFGDGEEIVEEPEPSAPTGSSEERETRPDREENREAYNNAIARLRKSLGEPYWLQNAKSRLQLKVLSANIESYDQLIVFDGESTAGNRRGKISNDTRGVEITSNDDSGAFTFTFRSDGSVPRSGWEILVRNPNASGKNDGERRMSYSAEFETDYIRLFDSGGEFSDYRNNENWTITVKPKSPAEAPASLLRFLASHCNNYDQKAAWVIAFAEGLESLNWSSNSRGSVLEKALLFSDENSLGRTEFKHWIELMALLPENDAISELTNLSNAFLACTDLQRSAILAQLTKAPRDRVELATIMSNAITAYPFHGQTEEFDLQSNNFFSAMSGWTESYAEGYAAMLVLFGEKNELRMAEIERIDLQFEEAKALAEDDYYRRTAEKRDVRLQSLLAIGGGISAIALIALLLVLLSIRRLLADSMAQKK